MDVPSDCTMKIKKKQDTFVLCDRFSNVSFKEYSDRMHSMTKNQLLNLYQSVFNRPCTVDPVWAKYQISYELARQQDIKAGNLERLQPGSAFRAAYKGAMACNLSAVGETLQFLIPYELKTNDTNSEAYMQKQQNKVNAMKKAAAAKAANRIGLTLKKSVIETWARVFQMNAKNKWTDEQISEFMHKEFPDLKNKTFNQVNGCRSHYNNGWYTKGAKPAERSVRYDEDGNVLSRVKKDAAKKAPAIKKEAAKQPIKKAIKPATAKAVKPIKKLAIKAKSAKK